MIKNSLLLIIFFFISTIVLNAQTFKGMVMDLNTSKPLAGVEIRSLKNDKLVETNAEGEFSISINLNELLSFSYPGYRIDTLVVTSYEFKRIYLSSLSDFTILKDVQINHLSDTELDQEIEATKNSGKAVHFFNGLSISPSRIFGAKGKEARRRHRLLLAEKKDRAIMAKFRPELISSLTPLKGKDLEVFINDYKPSYEFVMKSDEELIRLYIMDSYKDFKMLNTSPSNEKQ